MNKYIIINGKDIHLINQKSLENAVTYAENYMDNSKEIIVREFTNIHNASQIK